MPLTTTITIGAVVLHPVQLAALADLEATGAVALTQNPAEPDVFVDDTDGRRWRVEPDGVAHELEDDHV